MQVYTLFIIHTEYLEARKELNTTLMPRVKKSGENPYLHALTFPQYDLSRSSPNFFSFQEFRNYSRVFQVKFQVFSFFVCALNY